MESFADVINLWPSLSRFAADVGVSYGVAKQWRRRNSIPSERWAELLWAAELRAIDGLSANLLTKIAARKQEVA
jgi:hypothetical protein